MTSNMITCIVIGASLAGLTSAITLREAGLNVTIIDSSTNKENNANLEVKTSKVTLLPSISQLWKLEENLKASLGSEVQVSTELALCSRTSMKMQSGSRRDLKGVFVMTKYQDIFSFLYRKAASLGVDFRMGSGYVVSGLAMDENGGTVILETEEQLHARLIVVAVSELENNIAEMGMATEVHSDGSFAMENAVILGKLLSYLPQGGLDLKDILEAFRNIRAVRKHHIEGLNFEVVAVSPQSNIQFEGLRFHAGLERLLVYNLEDVVDEWWQKSVAVMPLTTTLLIAAVLLPILTIMALVFYLKRLSGHYPWSKFRLGSRALRARDDLESSYEWPDVLAQHCQGSDNIALPQASQSSDLSQHKDHGSTRPTSSESRPSTTSFLEDALQSFPPAVHTVHISPVPARPDTRASHRYDGLTMTEEFWGQGLDTPAVTLIPCSNGSSIEIPDDPFLMNPFTLLEESRPSRPTLQSSADISKIRPELAYWYTGGKVKAPKRTKNPASPVQRGALPLVRKSSTSSQRRMSVMRGVAQGLYPMPESEGDD
ncbi:hypothetical protein PQX77_017690 [Marasmius sp. AFHP31]|nr:hypothetical protein PQX77_017690 [Marasmius sp. AFHP31]